MCEHTPACRGVRLLLVKHAAHGIELHHFLVRLLEACRQPGFYCLHLQQNTHRPTRSLRYDGGREASRYGGGGKERPPLSRGLVLRWTHSKGRQPSPACAAPSLHSGSRRSMFTQVQVCEFAQVHSTRRACAQTSPLKRRWGACTLRRHRPVASMS